MRITRLGKIVTAMVVPTVAAATVLTLTTPDDRPSTVNVVGLPGSESPVPSVGPDQTTPSPTSKPPPPAPTLKQPTAKPSKEAPRPSRSPTPSPSPTPTPSTGSNPVEDLLVDLLF